MTHLDNLHQHGVAWHLASHHTEEVLILPLPLTPLNLLPPEATLSQVAILTTKLTVVGVFPRRWLSLLCPRQRLCFFRRPGEPRWPLVGIWLWLRRDLWRNYVKTTLVLVGLWNPDTLLGSNSGLLMDHTILGQPTSALLSQLS